MYKYQINLKGRKFGRWTVLKRYNKTEWICRCSCELNTTRPVSCYTLLSGQSEGCECIVLDITTKHGLWQHPISKKHSSMISRCYNKNDDSYGDYGARGIKVCKRWRNRETGILNFIRDMLPSYTEGMELDRYPDNNGDYEPNNVRWTTRRNNVNNRRNTKILIIKGITYPVTVAAEKFGIGPKTILYRKRIGWSDEDCITPPYVKRIELDKKLNRNKKKGRPRK